MAELFAETGPHTGIAIEAASGTGEVLVISPGWGSSGYYSPEFLEQRLAPAFTAGTHMYVDHPSAEEEAILPERSITKLAGRLTGDAVWRSDGPEGPGVYAPVEAIRTWRQMLHDQADMIGVSVRFRGTYTDGEAEGRRGRILDTVEEALSVDYVTRAGRGGKVLEMSEAARPMEEARNLGHWLEAHLHLNFTQLADRLFGEGRLSREERITLSGAIGSGLEAFAARVEADAPALFNRDVYADAPTGDAAAESDDHSTSTTGRTSTLVVETTQASQQEEQHVPEDTTAAEEAQRQADAALAEARQETARVEARLAVIESARVQNVPHDVAARIADRVCAGPIPTNVEGRFSADRAFEDRVKLEAQAEADYVRRRVADLAGSHRRPEDPGVTESQSVEEAQAAAATVLGDLLGDRDAGKVAAGMKG